jgi:hypothetical protein
MHPKEPKLSPLATVSRTWQVIVETVLFENISIESKEWDTFIVHICSSRMDRRKYLKVFNIQIKDLESLEEPLQFMENSESDQREFSQRLYCAVKEIYKEFGSLGQHLSIVRFYISFQDHPIIEQYRSQEYRSLVTRIPYISFDWLSEAENQDIHLLGIRKFSLSSDESRIAPASAFSLISIMPDLEYLNMELEEHEKRDILWREDLRTSKTLSPIQFISSST